ncbi:hypothetical protein ACIKTA_08500, partial [Hansschlegelia beijingensis]
MTEPRFFPAPQPLDLQALVALTGARRARGPEDASITGVAPPNRAIKQLVKAKGALGEIEIGRM